MRGACRVGAWGAALVLAACGGGGSSGGVTTYSIGGQVTGLVAGQTLTLQGPVSGRLVVSANGAFTLPEEVNASATYAVSVITQPAGQRCTVARGSGTARADVNDVAVSCQATSANAYAVGGTVSGLGAGLSLVLQNNAGDDVSVRSNGSFSFATPVATGAPYAVTLLTAPTGQRCVLSRASGVVASAPVADVSVVCQAVATPAPTLTPVYEAQPYTEVPSSLLPQLNAQGARGFAWFGAWAASTTDWANIYVKDVTATYTYELLATPTTAQALLAQMNAQGARGYAHAAFLLDGVVYMRDSSAAGVWRYELLPDAGTRSGLLAQANSQGARGFLHVGAYLLQGVTQAIYVQYDSSARYEMVLQPSTDTATPDAFLAQANAQGALGYKYLGAWAFPGEPADNAVSNLYVRDSTQSARFELALDAVTASTAGLIAQANAQGQLHRQYDSALAFFPNGYNQPEVLRNLYLQATNCAGTLLCRAASPL